MIDAAKKLRIIINKRPHRDTTTTSSPPIAASNLHFACISARVRDRSLNRFEF